jgi:hypothetical protein
LEIAKERTSGFAGRNIEGQNKFGRHGGKKTQKEKSGKAEIRLSSTPGEIGWSRCA